MVHLLPWISLASVFAFVHAQTLYEFVPAPPSSSISLDPVQIVDFVLYSTRTVSAGGTGADGMTTYVENGVVTAISEVVEFYGSLTTTVFPTTSTYTYLFLEDASRLVIPTAAVLTNGEVVAESCTFGADNIGACVAKVPLPSSTVTQTIPGSVAPWYTLVATPTSANSARGAFSLHSTFSIIMAIILPVVLPALLL
ncbi:hypothetical protein B0H11DRAFT_1218053 [Mycena galericulata]|nr:hypothetical protein B0H11DRAFT_1218053 [Mycena galericulata]